MSFSKLSHCALAALLLSVPAFLMAAPTAVDDVFSVNEDTPLSVSVTALVDVDFDTSDGSDGVIPFSGGTWRFLDRIENENGTVDGYPIDGAGRAWTHVNFSETTSSIVPWGSGSFPIQAGGLEVFPGAQTLLGGIDQAANGQNLVTTYLFTNTILLDEAPEAGSRFSVELVADDGCVIYINGVEVLRRRMPEGVITTETLASIAGTENRIELVDLDVPDGLLVAGTNAIAVEVHQVTLTSSDAGLYMVLREGSVNGGALGGFSYEDDRFDTTNPAYAAGAREQTVGFNGTAGLQVRCGGATPAGQPDSSGGWRREFTLESAGTVDVSLRYRLTANNGFEADEYIEARAEIDRVGIGNGAGGSLVRFVGDGNGGDVPETGWVQEEFTVSLAAGAHFLDLGLYINQSTVTTEIADVFFDDVLVSSGAGGGVGGVLANDSGEPDSLAAQLLTQPANGGVVMQADGTFVYTPDTNFFGSDTFTYRAADSTGNSGAATVTINVAAVNDPPVASERTFTTVEDQVLSVPAASGVLVGATDVDSPAGGLVAVLVGDVSNGTLVLNPSGAFTYSPASNFAGADSFSFQVSDGVAQSAAQVVTINVTGVDDPPLAVADAYSVDENGQLDVTIATGSGGGLVGLVDEGASWRYLADGSDQGVGWTATTFNDGGWATGFAQFGYGDGDEVTVIGWGPDEDNKFATTYFRKAFSVDASQLAEIDGLLLRLIRDDAAAVYLNGTEVVRSNLIAEADFSTRASSSTGNENGWREFEVDADLLVLGLNYVAVEIHQHDPDSSDLSFDFSLQGELSEVRGVLANDSDPEGGALTAVLETNAAHGSVSLAGDGTFSYTPTANYFGEDSFEYRVFSGGQSSVGTATITVVPGPNDVPMSVADGYAVAEDQLLTVGAATGVLANDSDPDGDPMEAVLLSGASNGELSLNADGSFSYEPVLNFSGSDSFVYRATDQLGFSEATVVTISITPVNDLPTARPDSFVVQPGQSFSGNVLANDVDVDGEALSAVLLGGADQGTLNLNSDGSFDFDPGAFVGQLTFFYEAVDTVGSRAEAQVLLVVNGRPTAVGDGYSVVEDGTLSVPVSLGLLGNDSDPEGGAMAALLRANVANGELSLAADGSFTYTPDADFSGVDSFTYLASDGFQTSESGLVAIDVQAVNDDPVAVADDYGVITNTALAVAAGDGVLANDIDVDGDVLQATLVSNVASGVLDLDSDGGFSYTPAAGFEGEVTFSYRASDTSANSTATVTLYVGPDLDTVMISEIMYHPASDLDSEEFIELTNIGPVAVNLNGWYFGDGVDFTFPAVTLPPGGYLAVAADVAAFEALHGAIGNVVGGWTGRLSNSGERIRLYDRNGVKVDDVSYADEGEWAARERVGSTRGWSWSSAHDGGGQSLELIFTGLTNEYGQSWAASQGGATPGRVNSTAAASVAPLILDVKHRPVVPKSTDPVRVSARLMDVEGSALSASLRWRVATMQSGAFSEVPMTDDDGDGVYGVTLPPFGDGVVVEFYVSASRGDAIRTWPAVTNVGQVANAHYQVDDEAHEGNWPIYRIVMTPQEIEDFDDVNRSSNERFHATLILDDCSGPVARYNSSIRVRGAGSRSHNPPPMRAAIPSDRPWNDRTAMNWNTKYTYSQYIGMRLFQGSGLQAPDGKPMLLRWNGEDRMRDDAFDYGLAVHMEVLDGDFIDDKFPDDADGNLYKKVRPDREWAFRDGAIGDYVSDGWSKETNEDENLWGDLDGFLDVMNNAAGDGNYIDQVEAVADLDHWMRWFGTMAIIANGETNVSNGADDDYSMYRGGVDQRFKFIPHDLDTILGDGDGSRITDPEHTIFDMISRGAVLDPLVPLFSNASVQTRYYQALRELLQDSFTKEEFDELVDNSLTGWVPPGEIENIKSFMDARRIYITGLVNAELGAAPPAAKGTTTPTLASSHGALMISEVFASNLSLDYFGTLPDFVEIYNSGSSSVSLAGMTMSDDPEEPGKFTFPAGTSLAAGARVLVFGDSDPATPGMHLGFGLSANGETIQLLSGATVVDRLTFGRQIPDYSLSRTGVGLNTWALSMPSPQTANTVQAVGDPADLRINEWLTQPETVFEWDFVELYNPSTLPVAMGGLAITDEPAIDPMQVQLPPLSFIAPGGFAVFEAVGDRASPGDSSELPFKLGSDQGWLSISGANGVEIDEVHYLCHRLDVSQGRSPDAGSSYADFTLPTPGFSNTANLSNEIAIVAGLRITELMYHPDGSGSEYVELRNVGDVAFNLDGVAFTEGISFEFPAMELQPGAFVLVVENPVAFESAYGGDLNVAGGYSGKLSNGGERLRLEIGYLGAGILDFEYDDAWYPTTDGDGFALEIIDAQGVPSSWGERVSWRAGSVDGGTPGRVGGDPAAYDNWVAAEFGAPVIGRTGKLDDPDDDGVANVLEFALGGDPQVGDRGEMLEFSNNGGFLTLNYRRLVASAGLVELVPEVSGDLQRWQSGGGLTVQEILGSDGEFETWMVRDAIPIGSGERRFLRILGICLDE